MIALKEGRQGFGQVDRDRRDSEISRAEKDRRARWVEGARAWDSEIAAARPGYGRVPYPVAVRRAAAAWDAAMDGGAQ